VGEYWFRPKRHGIGAGTPLNWKGWALFIVYVGAILASPFLLKLYFGYEPSSLVRLAVVAIISIPFLYLAWIKTEGGWQWRNGDEQS
jgi:hypothetical protein